MYSLLFSKHGSESEVVHAISGVPQGSVLGPLLFLVYIIDLCHISLSHGSQTVLYADDLVLYKVLGSNSCSAYGSMQEDIDRIAEWTNVNLLNFNRSKCKAMLISRRQHQHQPHLFYLQGDIIEQVCSYKYLGVMVTSNLKWDEHIDKVSLKAKRLLGHVYRVFYRNVQPHYLLNLYISLVRPHLEYACQVWDPYTQRSICQLESIQKFALKICTGQWNTRYGDLLENYNLPRLSNRREYLRLATLFQIHTHHFHFPPGILTQPRTTSTSNRHKTSHAYAIPFARTTSFQQSFIPRTISVWNSLPECVIDNDTSHFKHNLKIS